MATAVKIQAGGFSDFTAENKDASTLQAGAAIATHSSGVGIVKAQANSNATRAVGFVIEDIAPSFSGKFRSGGILTLPDWTNISGTANLDANSVYYLDETQPGKITITSPTSTGDYVQRVGTAVGPTSLEIEIEQPILL